MGEYRQAFLNSDLILDFGYTGGYKKTSSTKRKVINLIFSKFTKKFNLEDNKEANLEINYKVFLTKNI